MEQPSQSPWCSAASGFASYARECPTQRPWPSRSAASCLVVDGEPQMVLSQRAADPQKSLNGWMGLFMADQVGCRKIHAMYNVLILLTFLDMRTAGRTLLFPPSVIQNEDLPQIPRISYIALQPHSSPMEYGSEMDLFFNTLGDSSAAACLSPTLSGNIWTHPNQRP
jgi:hypothetical protein